jgi:hypothetical protein
VSGAKTADALEAKKLAWGASEGVTASPPPPPLPPPPPPRLCVKRCTDAKPPRESTRRWHRPPILSPLVLVRPTPLPLPASSGVVGTGGKSLQCFAVEARTVAPFARESKLPFGVRRAPPLASAAASAVWANWRVCVKKELSVWRK